VLCVGFGGVIYCGALAVVMKRSQLVAVVVAFLASLVSVAAQNRANALIREINETVWLFGSDWHTVSFHVPVSNDSSRASRTSGHAMPAEAVFVTYSVYSNSSGGAHNAMIVDANHYNRMGRDIKGGSDLIDYWYGWRRKNLTASLWLEPGSYYLLFFTDYWSQIAWCDNGFKLVMDCSVGRDHRLHHRVHNPYPAYDIEVSYRLRVTHE
jgi:hypothetical protein